MNERAMVAAGTAVIRQGSKSFAAAARLFDRRTREGAVLLYGWCRRCDDVVDDQHLGFGAIAASPASIDDRIAWLEEETRHALAGRTVRDVAFEGLREAVRRHEIPHELPLQHLAGFRMDVEGRSYETLGDTLDYAYHVAGVVGVMMAHVMGVRDAPTLDRASDLGIAFQLTNIARDIVDDARVGRVYLPRAWLTEAGIEAERLADPSGRAALAGIADRLIVAAEPYYVSSAVGLSALPLRSAWAIATAAGVYRRIGTEVRHRGEGAWDRRVSTSRAAKLRQVLTGGGTALASRIGGANATREGLYARPLGA